MYNCYYERLARNFIRLCESHLESHVKTTLIWLIDNPNAWYLSYRAISVMYGIPSIIWSISIPIFVTVYIKNYMTCVENFTKAVWKLYSKSCMTDIGFNRGLSHFNPSDIAGQVFCTSERKYEEKYLGEYHRNTLEYSVYKPHAWCCEWQKIIRQDMKVHSAPFLMLESMYRNFHPFSLEKVLWRWKQKIRKFLKKVFRILKHWKITFRPNVQMYLYCVSVRVCVCESDAMYENLYNQHNGD